MPARNTRAAARAAPTRGIMAAGAAPAFTAAQAEAVAAQVQTPVQDVVTAQVQTALMDSPSDSAALPLASTQARRAAEFNTNRILLDTNSSLLEQLESRAPAPQFRARADPSRYDLEDSDMEDESSTLPAVAASKVFHEGLLREHEGTYWNHLMVKIKGSDTIKTRRECSRYKVVRPAPAPGPSIARTSSTSLPLFHGTLCR